MIKKNIVVEPRLVHCDVCMHIEMYFRQEQEDSLDQDKLVQYGSVRLTPELYIFSIKSERQKIVT